MVVLLGSCFYPMHILTYLQVDLMALVCEDAELATLIMQNQSKHGSKAAQPTVYRSNLQYPA